MSTGTGQQLSWAGAALAAGLAAVYAVNGLTRKDGSVRLLVDDPDALGGLPGGAWQIGPVTARLDSYDLTRLESSWSRVGLWGTLLLVAGLLVLLALHARRTEGLVPLWLLTPGPYATAATTVLAAFVLVPETLRVLGAAPVLAAIGPVDGASLPAAELQAGWLLAAGAWVLARRAARPRPPLAPAGWAPAPSSPTPAT